MSGKVLMTAIGDINDKYIMEFAQVTPIKKQHRVLATKILPAVACLSIIVMSAVFLTKNNDMPYEKPGNVSNGSIIWGNGIGDNIVGEYAGHVEKGNIVITESLETAMENSDNEADLFAVLVSELTGASKKTVYNNFVKQLDVNEEYMENGIIFISESQIQSLMCPSDFALVLSLAAKPYEDAPVNQETLSTAESETIKVKVYLKYNVDGILNQNKEQLEKLNNEEYQKMRQSIVKTEVEKMVDAFIAAYEIDYDSLEEVGIYIPEFTVELDTTLIKRIIEDDRVDIVLEATDSVGLDQIQ